MLDGFLILVAFRPMLMVPIGGGGSAIMASIPLRTVPLKYVWGGIVFSVWAVRGFRMAFGWLQLWGFVSGLRFRRVYEVVGSHLCFCPRGVHCLSMLYVRYVGLF